LIHTLHVVLGQRTYPIHVGSGVLGQADTLLPRIGRRAVIVSNATVAARYLAPLKAALARAGVAVDTILVPDGEAHKSWPTLQDVLTRLLELGADRATTLVALGGGVVGDLAGFAAAIYQRGIAFVQVPTTLLAQVDSSVGGKTAVDIPAGKNLVGAFHPPRAVIADTRVLATLPPRELRAGLAEVVKYGAIVDAPFLDWLAAHSEALLGGDADTLSEAIARSCAHKAAIVERDPFEHGERALLNFGHTFGHAIETAQDYGTLNHGEAVAVGMVLAARLSTVLGLATDTDAMILQALLQRFGLPTALPAGLDPDVLLAHMRLDKKAQASGLRFVLWEGLGRARVVPDVPEEAVLGILRNA
jgi:3-dehydroquinate synthase